MVIEPTFQLTKHLLQAYFPPEEFKLAVIYAPLGYGKTTYQFKVTADYLMCRYKLTEKEAWESVKYLLVFHPEQFFEKLDQGQELGYDRLLLNWDDAGLWLFALDFHDPFIEEFIKWLNVARSDCVGLLCSTPSPMMVIRKLRNFPEAIKIRIIKPSGHTLGHRMWHRIAKAYHLFLMPDERKYIVRKMFADQFICQMPNDFYEWYKPRRKAYAKIARRLLKQRWEELKARSRLPSVEEEPDLIMPSLKELHYIRKYILNL
mgnify:CR=1 FL=1